MLRIIRHRCGATALPLKAPCLIACMLALRTVNLSGADSSASAPTQRPPLTEERLVELFRPLQTEIAALSPDGRLIAYSLREGETLSLVVVAIDQPEVAKAKIAVLTDRDATPVLSITTSERTPAQITWLAWATPTRLVMETNQNIALTSGSGATITWQNASGALVAVDANGSNARMLLTARDLPVLNARLPVEAPENVVLAPDGREFGERAPRGPGVIEGPEWRVPRFFDFSPDHPDEILVIAENPPKFGLYAVNVHTGKHRRLDDHTTDSARLTLIDRQGRIRIGVPNSILHRFPHEFAVPVRQFARAWQPLDEIVPESERGFQVSPQNFFVQRAVPLAFDDDGKRLYFASNVGRETFGVYSLDVASGQRAGLVVENPHVDLWEPHAGVFPDAGLFLPQIREAAAGVVPLNPVAAGEEPGDPAPIEIFAPGAAPGTTGLVQPYREGPLVFDRFTRKLVGIRYRATRPSTIWLRPDFTAVQKQLEASVPGRSVEIQHWDEAANRFLVLLRSPADPGSFCVFDRGTGKLAEFAPRLPQRQTRDVPATLEFGFAGPTGIPIAGFVTVPTAPKLKPIPMIVLCPPFPWERTPWDYRADVEALAEMGFVVVQFQGRGAWGAGVRRREAITAGYEEAQLADILAVIDHLTTLYHVNPQRVALFGEQHGGFVALRGLQLHPDRFRCAVAIHAPVDLAAWQERLRWNNEAFGPLLTSRYLGDAAHFEAAPLVRNAAAIQAPALLLHYRGTPGESSATTFLAAKRLAEKLERPEAPTTFIEVERDFVEGRPVAKARAFAQIAEFFNLTIYDYTVEVGPETVVEP